MKTCPRLKNSSERPNESSASRSSVCHDRMRRRSTSPRKKTALSGIQVHHAVQHLAAERADPPARHAPRDLGPGQGLGDSAVAVLDLAERDLAGAARPDLDRPAPRRLVEGRIGLRASAGSARASGRPSGYARNRARAPALRQPRRRRSSGRTAPRRNWCCRRVVAPVGRGAGRDRVDRCCRPRRRPARAAARAPRRTPTASPAEGPELVADEVQRRHEHDRDGLRDDLPDARSHQQVENDEVREERTASRRRGTATPGAPTWPRSTRNVQTLLSA